MIADIRAYNLQCTIKKSYILRKIPTFFRVQEGYPLIQYFRSKKALLNDILSSRPIILWLNICRNLTNNWALPVGPPEGTGNRYIVS